MTSRRRRVSSMPCTKGVPFYAELVELHVERARACRLDSRAHRRRGHAAQSDWRHRPRRSGCGHRSPSSTPSPRGGTPSTRPTPTRTRPSRVVSSSPATETGQESRKASAAVRRNGRRLSQAGERTRIRCRRHALSIPRAVWHLCVGLFELYFSWLCCILTSEVWKRTLRV